MYFLDRELIYPSKLDEVYPPWINHAMHTYPPFLALIYLLASKKPEPQMKHSLAGMIVLLVIYGACEYVYFSND